MADNLKALKTELARRADPAVAAQYRRFFKSGPGEYGEGDRFIGLRVPELRALITLQTLSDEETVVLLQSPIHEHRLAALLYWVEQYKTAGEVRRRRIFNLYWRHRAWVNNWDLVDLSAPQIAGHFLYPDAMIRRLEPLAHAASLWDRRIAMVASLYAIKRDYFQPALRLAHILLHDEEPLIHKAAGWMLRELGKRDEALLEFFLRIHADAMPRTMLRYAIERFDPERYQSFLRGTYAPVGTRQL